MRIIAGKLKGRKIIAGPDNRIRPTSDRVKEAIFSMISPYLEDAVVIDLFSGTGNLGLEAISRGVYFVYFGDKFRESMNIIKKNIEICQVEKQSNTILGSWDQVLNRIPHPVDIIFLDPPYQSGLIEKCINKIESLSLLKKNGIIVTEYRVDEPLPMIVDTFNKIKEKKYGNTMITIYSI